MFRSLLLAFALLATHAYAATGTLPIRDGQGNLQTVPAESNNGNLTPHSVPEVAGAAVSSTNPLPSASPDARQTAQALSLTALNNAFTVALANGEGTVAMQIVGLTAGAATLAVEASNDGGTTWNAINALVPSNEGSISQTLTADGGIRINAAGHTNLRLRVSVVGTGSATISYSASVAQGVTTLGAALPPGSNVIGSIAPVSATLVNCQGGTASIVSTVATTATLVCAAGTARSYWRVSSAATSGNVFCTDDGSAPTLTHWTFAVYPQWYFDTASMQVISPAAISCIAAVATTITALAVQTGAAP